MSSLTEIRDMDCLLMKWEGEEIEVTVNGGEESVSAEKEAGR